MIWLLYDYGSKATQVEFKSCMVPKHPMVWFEPTMYKVPHSRHSYHVCISVTGFMRQPCHGISLLNRGTHEEYLAAIWVWAVHEDQSNLNMTTTSNVIGPGIRVCAGVCYKLQASNELAVPGQGHGLTGWLIWGPWSWAQPCGEADR